MRKLRKLQPIIEWLLPGLVFILLGLWTYALFVHVPYAGFEFNPSDGRVAVVYNESPDVQLLEGDQLLQVGTITWDAFKSDLRQPLFSDKQSGQVIPLRIQREGKESSINWVYLGFTWAEFWERLYSEWILAYVFWLTGTIALLFLRPKDERWRLFVAFNFLTALSLAGGSGVSRWHVWEGAIKPASLMWLFVPVYLHLHWVFPRPLGTLPAPFYRCVYLVASLFTIAAVFELVPLFIFWGGFLLAVVGSLILLALHVVRQPDERREIVLLIVAASLALFPAIGVGIVRLFHILPANAGVGLIALPALPFGYLYVAARRQLGNLELRTNRLISLYIFVILLSTATSILVPLAHSRVSESSQTIGITLIAVLLTAIIAIIGFAPFQRWIERYLLGMPLPPTDLLETYATQITTSLDLKHLLLLLQEQILPSLLVRQAALLQLDEGGRCTLLGAMGIDDDQLPTHDDLSQLLAQKGRSRRTSEPLVACCPWVRVILPLQIEDETIGLWLLGRRDPNDFYTQTEIATLQAIANQTAIALTNIEMAKQLHALHQVSIDRQESEHSDIARELHDAVLNELAVLYGSAQHEDPSRFEDNYHLVVQKVRHIIKGLRPPLLIYGLRPALQQLIYDLTERDKEGLLWELDLCEENIRYDPSVEQHLFRIVQQACENVFRHAKAYTIFVTSRFTPTKVELIVADDGIGFESDKGLDLNHLLTNAHFGLVGMLERAAIIGATVQIESKPKRGTSVHVIWQASKTE